MKSILKWFNNLRVQFIQSNKGCKGLTGCEEQCANCSVYNPNRTYCNIPE
jgi:hypothetical protein